jgi:TIR domain
VNLFFNKSVLPRWLKKLLNVTAYRGYSFCLKPPSVNKKLVKPGTPVVVTGLAVNNGFHNLATCYIIFRIIDPYNPKQALFNSDRDLAFEQKRSLLVHDVPKGQSRPFSFTWQAPAAIDIPLLYIKIDVWSPRKLYRKQNLFYYPYLFDSSGWKAFVEVITKQLPPAPGADTVTKGEFLNTGETLQPAGDTGTAPHTTTGAVKEFSVFISYAWFPYLHKQWVFQLADKLTRAGLNVIIDRDLYGGQEITLFMERKIE